MAKNWRFEIQSRCVLSTIPKNVMPGFKNKDEPLPKFTLWGMVNVHGASVKLRFNTHKEYIDITTYNHTERIRFNEIADIISNPIENEEQYSTVCFQYGHTETSKYWVFWVPSQYVKSMKSEVLGKWPGF